MMPQIHDDGSVQFGMPKDDAKRVADAMMPHAEKLLACAAGSAPGDEVMQIVALLSAAGALLAARAGQTGDELPDAHAIQLADVLVAQVGPVYLASLLTRLSIAIPQMTSYALTMKAMDEAVNGANP